MTCSQETSEPLNVLVACEFSGVVREAFRALGHNAWSCDLLSTEIPGQHMKGDIRNIIATTSWDLMIAHPPCTFLTKSGVRWLYAGGKGRTPDPQRWENMRAAALFFRELMDAPIARIAVENPVMHRYASESIGRKYDQIIHPWQFGHYERKATGLWLKGLPKLAPTDNVGPPPVDRDRKTWDRVHYAAPGADRWKERSRTLRGIATAMAQQWGVPGQGLDAVRENQAAAWRDEVAA